MKKILVVVIALSMLLGLFVVRPASVNAAGFGDVPGNYWAKDQIDYLVAKDVIAGFPDGTFKPETPVTREQFAKMVCIAKGIKEYKPSTPTFNDVNSSRWSYGFVEAAAKAGYIKGYPDGTFGPEKNITRQELAVLGVRVLGKESQALNLNKTLEQPVAMANDEQKVATWAYGAVTIAYSPKVQMMNYRKGRLIAPLASATRAECANSIYMMVVPPKDTPVLSFCESQEPSSLSMDEFSATQANVDPSSLIMDRYLIGMDEDPVVLYPRMVREVPSQENGLWKVYEVNGEERMTITYRLRKGLKWSDGQPITSKDIKFSWEVRTSPNVPCASNAIDLKVEKVETPDDYTAIFYFKQADVEGFRVGLLRYPEHIFREEFKNSPEKIVNDPFWQDPVGNGPYKLAKWLKGERLEFEPNPYWFYGEPVAKKIIEYVVPNSNTIMAKLLAGELDIAFNTGFTPQQVSTIKESKGIGINVTVQPLSATHEHLRLNVEDPILSDVRVRKALAYATNRDEIDKVVYAGQFALSYDWFDNHKILDRSSAIIYPYDPSKANALLDEAGWKLGPDGYRYKDGKKLEIQFTLGTEKIARISTIEVVAKEWKQVGVSVTMKTIPWTVLMTDVLPKGNYQASIFNWGASLFDITANAMRNFDSSQIPTKENGYMGNNLGRWSNPEFDKAIEAASNSVRDPIIQANVKTAMKIWTDQVPAIVLFHLVEYYCVRTNVRSYIPFYGKGPTDDLPFTYKL
jgi:peptide/nickel transport system substrate-binding protein